MGSFKGKVRVYGIAGTYDARSYQKLFGGFLVVDPASGDIVQGRIIDSLGPAKVTAGRLKRRELFFRKRYEGCNDNQEFNYAFSSLGRGCWKGGYNPKESNLEQMQNVSLQE